jgi:hypothetical protein
VDTVADVFALTAAGIVFLWGVSHVIPTRQVVAGFGDISEDNSRIITMEWVAEGLSFMFVAVLIVAVTWSGETLEAAEDLVYRVSSGFLVAIGVWTAMTGARTGVIWFKACPVVMSVSAGLLITASFL